MSAVTASSLPRETIYFAFENGQPYYEKLSYDQANGKLYVDVKNANMTYHDEIYTSNL